MLSARPSMNWPAVTRRLLTLFVATITITPAAALAASPGSLDSSFGSGGIATMGQNTRLFGTAVQSDGKVVAVGESGAGSSADVLVARFTSSGALDHSFGSGGLVQGPAVPTAGGSGSLARAVAIQPDGKIVVVGRATTADGTGTDGLLIERYDSNGGLDHSFGSGGVVNLLSSTYGDGYAVAIQPDGKIVATGAADAAGSGGTFPRVAVARLSSNGSLDTSFGSGGIDVLDLGAYSYADAVALQGDGKIVIAGSQRPGLEVTNALIARLTPSGARDSSFAGSGAFAQQYAASGGAYSGFDAVRCKPTASSSPPARPRTQPEPTRSRSASPPPARRTGRSGPAASRDPHRRSATPRSAPARRALTRS